MDSGTITNIIIGSIGFIIAVLFSIVAWFIVKGFSDNAKNTVEQGKSIKELVSSIEKLSNIIESIKMEFSLKHSGIEQVLKEHHEEIEMLRKSRHEFGNALTKVMLMGQLKCGWEFSADFSMPGVEVK